ncbi:hypothetical protein B4064_1280 [Caldibacillus thermoamylovorans]|nr:hypothetical protein B4166_0060 [Caldibacillus thermoamylovorans]KIO69435.1 hypothetical protein B4064_1280 [Caldibacillus thermoamylovorans]
MEIQSIFLFIPLLAGNNLLPAYIRLVRRALSKSKKKVEDE